MSDCQSPLEWLSINAADCSLTSTTHLIECYLRAQSSVGLPNRLMLLLKRLLAPQERDHDMNDVLSKLYVHAKHLILNSDLNSLVRLL